jgi:hypothetical protein
VNNTKLILAALSASAVASMATPALAGPSEDAFASFQQVCTATGSEFGAAIAAADSAGWKAAQVTADTMPNVSVTDKQARDKTIGNDNLTLFATRGVMASKAGNITVSTCTVSSEKADAASLIALTQKWLGAAPASTTPTKTGFRYALTGVNPGPVPEGGISAAVSGDGMVLMSVQSGPGKTILDIEKFKK